MGSLKLAALAHLSTVRGAIALTHHVIDCSRPRCSNSSCSEMGCAHSAPAVVEPLPSGANSSLRKVQDAPKPSDPDSPEALAKDTYCERAAGLLCACRRW